MLQQIPGNGGGVTERRKLCVEHRPQVAVELGQETRARLEHRQASQRAGVAHDSTYEQRGAFANHAAIVRDDWMAAETRTRRQLALFFDIQRGGNDVWRDIDLVAARRQRLSEQQRDRLPDGRGICAAARHIDVAAAVIHHGLGLARQSAPTGISRSSLVPCAPSGPSQTTR